MNPFLFRPRFTVRSLMAVGAIVAVWFGGTLECRRLRELSDEHGKRALSADRQVHWYHRGASLSQADWEAGRAEIARTNQGAWFKVAYFPNPDRCRRLEAYHEALRLKYERAARYPFLPIAPNPPYPLSQ